MKIIFTTILLIVLFSTVKAGEPYYLISRGIADASVVAVYGYSNNKTPCITLERWMNKAMEEERNYHKFSCVDGTTAMVIDCRSEKDKEYNCIENWKVRNELLRSLDVK